MQDPAELPPVAAAPLSVILPVRQGGDQLDKVVEEWVACLDHRGNPQDEVLVVDDGSTEDAVAGAEALAGRYARLKVLRHTEKLGFGAALRTGLAAARNPLVAYTTADGQYRAADLATMLQWIDTVHLVCGYRLRRPWFGPAAIQERLRRGLLRILFGLRLRDTDCFYVLARREIFRRIPIQSDGAFAHIEILAKANFLGCLMTDAPVARERPGPGTVDLTPMDPSRTTRELNRVFKRPDFGPTFVLDQTTWTRGWVRSMSPFAP